MGTQSTWELLSSGHVSKMTIDRDFLAMEIDEESQPRMYFEEESGFNGGQSEESMKRFKNGPDNLMVEFALIGAVAFICIILFMIYIRLAKNEDIPKEYFMKNRIPLMRKVLKNQMDIKKVLKKKNEYLKHI